LKALSKILGINVRPKSGHNSSPLADLVIVPGCGMQLWRNIRLAGVGFIHVPGCCELSILQKYKFGQIAPQILSTYRTAKSGFGSILLAITAYLMGFHDAFRRVCQPS
jgi:hypothetical protein